MRIAGGRTGAHQAAGEAAQRGAEGRAAAIGNVAGGLANIFTGMMKKDKDEG